MNTFRSQLFLGLLVLTNMFLAKISIAQKAYPVEITSLLSRIPIPQDAAGCYSSSTKSTDPSNGAISVVDPGPAFKELQDQLQKINMSAAGGIYPNGQTPDKPSAEQIEQMKQEAMQRAAQAQNGQAVSNQHTTQGAMDDPQIMKEIGQAQTACGQINQLIHEFSMKISAIDNSSIDKVSMGPNCPEVQQGGYAGPTCGCMKERAKTYELKRVAERNAYMQNVVGVLREYLGKIRPLCAQVDNVMIKAKFGDAVSNPAYKQMVAITQRQALGAVPALLSVASGTWEDAAKQYANLVNAESGASVGCFGKK